MEIRYDPNDYAVADPYEYYSILRENAPVYYNEELDFWALSRHADVKVALSDHRRFSSTGGTNLAPSATGSGPSRIASIVAMDPPEHLRIRRIVASFFSRRNSSRLEPLMRHLARNRLDALLRADHFDFVADFAAKIPMEVLASIIGAPTHDTDMIRHLAELLVLRTETDQDLPRSAVSAIVELHAYYQKLVLLRRKDPQDDLISLMTSALGDGTLIQEEIVAFCFLLTTAGNDSSYQLMGNAWYWAWRNPRQRHVALAGRTHDWVQETLRYDTPTQVVSRITVSDVQVSGEIIPQDARVVLILGSANRDPEVFPDPDRYDLDRDTSQILSFGNGLHLCLAKHVVSMLAEIVLEQVACRVRDFEVDEQGIHHEIRSDARGFISLPTTVRRR